MKDSKAHITSELIEVKAFQAIAEKCEYINGKHVGLKGLTVPVIEYNQLMLLITPLAIELNKLREKNVELQKKLDKLI